MGNGLSIAMLGWKAQATTRHTLETYRDGGLFGAGDEFFIYFNQFSAPDKALADEFKVRAIGTDENLGMWGGDEAIAENAKGDYILFLQDDHPVLVSPEEVKHWIDGGLELLKSGKADIIYLRHRQESIKGYGCDTYFRYHYVHELEPRIDVSVLPENYNRDTFCRKLRRLFRPFAARKRSITAMYLEKDPLSMLPKGTAHWEKDFLVIDSSMIQFSESPYMISRKLYKKLVAWGKKHPRHRTILGFQELEYILNCRWWRRQHFKIATCDTGIFGHCRIDGSWRKENGCYDATLVKDGWKK